MEHDNKLKKLMEQKELSVEQLCFLTGLTHMTIRNAIKGSNVTLATMKAISKAVKEPYFKIWPGHEEAAA